MKKLKTKVQRKKWHTAKNSFKLKGKGNTKNKLVLFLIISTLLFSSTLIYDDQDKPEQTDLGTVAQEIKKGKVKSIDIKNNNLIITKTDDTKQESKKEPSATLTEELERFGVTSKELSSIIITIKGPTGWESLGRIIIPILPVFILLGILLWFMLRGAKQGAGQIFSFGQSKAKMSGGKQGKKQDVRFTDVAGEEEAIEELKEVVEFLKFPKKFLDMGAKIPRGFMLMGPPGTGKTLLARAVSGEAGVPFYSISGSAFVEMFVGVGAARVRDLFQNAKRTAPSIIFIDEIDAVGRVRGSGFGGGSDEREQTLNQILSEMDGFDQSSNVIVVAATNRPDVLDSALLRPGRFDRRILIDLPDIEARKKIIKLHTKGKPMSKDIKIDLIGSRTPGFSGADLANLVNEAAIFAARKNKTTIDQQDMYEAVEKVILGPERKSRVAIQKDKEIAAFHEAGHALVTSILPDGDPVHKISIISRGRAGGYTLKLPDKERSFKTVREFKAELAVMLGGYVAEEITFKEVTTGSSDDLKKATDLARSIVTQFGMSKKLGPVVFGEREESIYLRRPDLEKKNYSEQIAQVIDAEIKSLIIEAQETATDVITKNNKKLKEIADVLLEKETLEKEEFDKIMSN